MTRRRPTVVASTLGLGVLIATAVAVTRGQYHIALGDLADSLARRLSGSRPAGADGTTDAVLWDVRMPRVAMAIVAGAALAAAGTVMQGLFRNPLAEPGIIGVSSGAALGATTVIALGLSTSGRFTTPLAAALGACAVTALIAALARRTQPGDANQIVLVGVAINALAAAGIGVAVTFADPQARQDIVFWQLGSLNGIRWSALIATVPLIAVGLGLAAGVARRLDVLALGASTARHLGVSGERTQVASIAATALLVGPATAMCGMIGFVGLIVPHALRVVLGPKHLPLLLTSLIGGALTMLIADTAARSAIAFTELPIGMLTALVGGPTLLLLLHRAHPRRVAL